MVGDLDQFGQGGLNMAKALRNMKFHFFGIGVLTTQLLQANCLCPNNQVLLDESDNDEAAWACGLVFERGWQQP